jgi:uncharacterized protein YndB with AHSA1/START domain
MITVARSVVINRPIDQVFDFVANFENEPRWMPGILESRKTSVGPIGVGTTFREVVQNLGPRMENTFAVTQYVPPRTFAIKSTSGPLEFQVTYSFEPITEGTRFTGTGAMEPQGFFKLIAPLFAAVVGRQIQQGRTNLKHLLETQSASAG